MGPTVTGPVQDPLAVNTSTTNHISPNEHVVKIYHQKCTVCWINLESPNVYKSIIWHWCIFLKVFRKIGPESRPMKIYEVGLQATRHITHSIWIWKCQNSTTSPSLFKPTKLCNSGHWCNWKFGFHLSVKNQKFVFRETLKQSLQYLHL